MQLFNFPVNFLWIGRKLLNVHGPLIHILRESGSVLDQKLRDHPKPVNSRDLELRIAKDASYYAKSVYGGTLWLCFV